LVRTNVSLGAKLTRCLADTLGVKVLIATIDSRIRLSSDAPKPLLAALRAEFSHVNPDFHKRRNSGRSTWGVSSVIKTYQQKAFEDGSISLELPRGGVKRLIEIATGHGVNIRWIDNRVTAPVQWPEWNPEIVPRWYQREFVNAVIAGRNCIGRAPTGSGKSIALLAALHQLGQRALIIVRDGNLLKQWVAEACRVLKCSKSEIGIFGSGRVWKPGKFLTLALQQSLHTRAESGELAEMVKVFGAVAIDEAQTIAARTFLEDVTCFASKWILGVSADERRRDGKEFLTHDMIGPVVYEIDRETIEGEGVVVPVVYRVIVSEHRADWYAGAEPADRDFNALIAELTESETRNELIVSVVQSIIDFKEETPMLVFTHRREHASELADRKFLDLGIHSGLLLGGTGSQQVRYQDDLAKLKAEKLRIAVGTFKALGVGIDIPNVRSGLISTPLSAKNPQFANQVRGRICRGLAGKEEGILYYIWDRHIFPQQLSALWDWSAERVEFWDGANWIRATSLKQLKAAHG
jgi:superfamily II DNA or RNA helicase